MHAFVNSGHERLQGLVLLLSDREEVVIGIKSRPRLLRDMHNCQFLPDLDRIINDAIKMDALLFGDIEV
ncbi:hypothetical protein SERLA73DRAFT_143345 [Serpula lacrymans var. lacrymans S7.3]|uniref:Uncharacterized protein n=1 Tax=Serpula lacrymans var. lacrymans (strain S7.3) TaxID=936435 RepID=F8Q9I3_SERL3|nr:hypothetical protein SERLA73DRAFT_143345 [Serpula lacrymans var. lacrymans S7.3]